MTAAEPPRWRYRFANFDRAYRLLAEAVALMEQRPLSALEQEGLVQRFEYSWELAWKTLKDLLEHSGVLLPTATPRTVLRSALEAGLAENGEAWMQALDARNAMAHTYSAQRFERIVADIRASYCPLLAALHTSLLARIAGEER